MGRRKLKITFNGSLMTPLKLSNPNELQWASHQVATFQAYMELETYHSWDPTYGHSCGPRGFLDALASLEPTQG